MEAVLWLIKRVYFFLTHPVLDYAIPERSKHNGCTDDVIYGMSISGPKGDITMILVMTSYLEVAKMMMSLKRSYT